MMAIKPEFKAEPLLKVREWPPSLTRRWPRALQGPHTSRALGPGLRRAALNGRREIGEWKQPGDAGETAPILYSVSEAAATSGELPLAKGKDQLRPSPTLRRDPGRKAGLQGGVGGSEYRASEVSGNEGA